MLFEASLGARLTAKHMVHTASASVVLTSRVREKLRLSKDEYELRVTPLVESLGSFPAFFTLHLIVSWAAALEVIPKHPLQRSSQC